MTSTTTPLSAFMAEHSITGNVTYSGHDTSDGWAHHAFRANLYIAGDLYLGNMPYSAGMGHEPSDVTLEDVFGAVLSDISSIDGCEDWTEWADDLALITDAKSAKKAMQDYGEISARAELLREAIGADAYAEALDIASEL